MSAAPVAGAQRPPRILAWANRGLIRALDRGRGPTFLRLLTVPGRISGEPRTTPIVPVVDGDRVWLVSAYGDVAWVRNLRAAGRVELRRGDDRRSYRARELDAHEAVPVLRTYLSMRTALFVRRRFGVTPDSTDDAIAADAPAHPTFELVPAPDHDVPEES